MAPEFRTVSCSPFNLGMDNTKNRGTGNPATRPCGPLPVQAELGPARVLLQAAFVLAARHQRKRSWSAATGFPKGQQLAHDHGSNAPVGSSSLNKRARNCLTCQSLTAVFSLALTGALAI